jgi:ABC-2 type transport system permease protein
MRESLKSEFRKLLTARMTYIVTIIGFLSLGGLMSFYGMGLSNAVEGSVEPNYLASAVLANVNFMAIFICVVALLMVTHEYRYNMITYTLTSSNSRTKSFLAKFIVISIFALVVTAMISVIGPLLVVLAMKVKGFDMVPQNIPYLNLAWRSLYFGLGMSSFATIIALLIRNQVGAIMTFFIAVDTIEGLLSLLLKENAQYLPFASLQHVISFSVQTGTDGGGGMSAMSPEKGLMVSAVYIVFGLLVTWLLFLRRDAN